MQDAPERAGMTFLDLPQPSIARSTFKFYNGHLLGFKNIMKLSGEGVFSETARLAAMPAAVYICMDSSCSLTPARAKTLPFLQQQQCYRPLNEKFL